MSILFLLDKFTVCTYRMSGVQSSWNNTQTYMNQYSRLGNRQPPNMVNVPSDLLQAASPKIFDLNAGTKVDMTKFMEVTSNCRNYSGYSGLRELQVANSNRTALEPGCGWILTPGGGGRGAYGVKDGLPTLSKEGELDIISDGNIFVKDLIDAERQAIGKIATSINNTCSRMGEVGSDNKPFVGYCKSESSGKVIPIITNTDKTFRARFPTDIKYGCVASDIIPASNTSLCPEPFQNYRNISSRTFDKVDGFVDTSFLDTCSGVSPSSGDWTGCVQQAVKAAGCREKGSLYQDPTGMTAAYKRAFEILGNPPMNTIENVYDTIDKKIANQVGATTSNAAAIQELCFQQNYLQENYNFCSDITDGTKIDADNFDCVMNEWRNKHAATRGISAPSLTKWKNKTFGTFRTYANNLMSQNTQTDKDQQVLAISRTIGTPTYGETYSANPSPKVNCVMNDFGAWSACSVSACGTTGTQTRTRTERIPASGGGTACPASSETQTCSTAPCPTPRNCSGIWSKWSPYETCEKASEYAAYGTPGATLTRTYTVTRAANGGKDTDCGPGGDVTKTESLQCGTVGCPEFTEGTKRIMNNTDEICMNGFRFKWLGDYKLQYTIPGNDQANFNSIYSGCILTSRKDDSWNITWNNRNLHFGNVMIGNLDINNINVGNKVKDLIMPNIGQSGQKDVPRHNTDKTTNITTNTRGQTWVNFLIISEDKESSLIIRNSGIVNVGVPYMFNVYGENPGNNQIQSSDLVPQIGPSVGTPRLCKIYKLYYALTTETCTSSGT